LTPVAGSEYDRIAGLNHERIAALSDGIFAVAMTLLVLGVTLPAAGSVRPGDESGLVNALLGLGPRMLAYVMSFLTLGIFWVGQHTQLTHMHRSDRRLTWIYLGFLFGVTLVPLSTAVVAQFIAYRVAVLVYWLNLLILGAALFASLEYIHRHGFLRAEMSAQVYRASRRRILTFQALYAVAASLCVINTYVSLGLIVALQLVAVLGPRFWPFSRF
jgi:uncharacterized membrane protein